MPRAIAIANNDVVQIAWNYDNKLQGCLGFAVYRKEGAAAGAGQWQPLPAWVGFEGQSNPAWTEHTTEEWPIQKFEWRDLEAARGKTYSYRIVPMTGNPGAGAPLQPLADDAVTAGPVTLTPQRGSFATYFNRGILSTQFLAHAIPPGPSGAPDYKVLTNRIDQPGDPLRNALAGQILEGLELLLRRAAAEGGACYAALYELTDPELVQLLLGAGNLHLILSNAGTHDSENQPARQALHDRGIDIVDRFVPSGHIGHNKFCVYADAGNTPQAVLLGSTNWTDTAVCAQSNNALVVANPDLARAYLDYWKRLHADCTDDRSRQGPQLRESNMQPGTADLAIDGAGRATVWFAPNTAHPRSSHPGAEDPVPPDLEQVFALMSKAKQAILFLEFEPGKPSVVDHAATCLDANPELFVRGAVTDPNAVGDFTTHLTHRGGDTVPVVAASAVNDQFAYWQRELLKAGPQAHAIIHDKIVVIDPMSPDCVVVTGSHNQGYRASYNNDENLLIVRGHQPLAQAYAVHVMDVYDHYRFRYVMDKAGAAAFAGLKRDDTWQDRYFDPNDPTSKDEAVWFPPAGGGE